MLATRYQGSLVQEPRRLLLADGWREKSCRGGGLRTVASRKPQRAYRWPDSGACSAEAEQRGGCGRRSYRRKKWVQEQRKQIGAEHGSRPMRRFGGFACAQARDREHSGTRRSERIRSHARPHETRLTWCGSPTVAVVSEISGKIACSRGGSPHCNGRNAAREATRCKRAPQGTALPGEMAFSTGARQE